MDYLEGKVFESREIEWIDKENPETIPIINTRPPSAAVVYWDARLDIEKQLFVEKNLPPR